MAESKLEQLWRHTAWLGALAGALALAVAAGLAVYVVMDRQHTAQFDAAVQSAVDEQMAAMAGAPQGAPPTSVVTAAVEQRTVQDRAAVIGRLREVRRATVASEVEGRVLEVLVDIGDTVVAGETVLARVDDVWANLQVEQAQADLAAAAARSRQAERELEHLESLAARNASDRRAIDDARAAAEAEHAEVQAQTAALHRAEESAARVQIVAPFDGVVTRKHAEQGQWLDPGGAVVEIISSGVIDAVIDVPEQQVGFIELGMPIDVVVEATGQTLTGTVAAVNPDGQNAARTFPVKVRLANPDGLLKVGMSVVAHVPLSVEREHLLVPRDAVSFTPQGAQVWIVGPMPGAPDGGLPVALSVQVRVLFGLGDLFVVDPQPKMPGLTLMPGMPVVVQGAEMLWPTRPAIVTSGPGGPGGGGGPPGAGGPPDTGDAPAGGEPVAEDVAADGAPS